MSPLIAASAFFALAAAAPASPLLVERGTCNADNLLRLLRTPANLGESLPFCSRYLMLPMSTLAVATLTPTNTLYDTSVATIFPTTTTYTTEVASISPTQTILTTDFSTETSTFIEVISTTSTVIVSPAVVVRAAKTPISEQVVESYPASRISSACACLTIPVAISSVTATAPDETAILTVQTTSTAPEVTQIITISSTTTLPEATQIITLQATTDTSVTQTQTTVIVSTSTLAPLATKPAGFFLRTYRANPDNFFAANYLVNRNLNNLNDFRQYVSILGSNSSAPRFDLTSEGYLKIISSRTSGSATTGTEDLNWVAYIQVGVVSQNLLFDKLANIQSCANCQVLTFVKSVENIGTFVNLANDPSTNNPSNYNFQICSSSGNYPFQITTLARDMAGCFQMRMFVAKEGVYGPYARTPA